MFTLCSLLLALIGFDFRPAPPVVAPPPRVAGVPLVEECAVCKPGDVACRVRVALALAASEKPKTLPAPSTKESARAQAVQRALERALGKPITVAKD